MDLFKAMDDLLKRPDQALEQSPYRILAGAVLCDGAYAVVTGLFQGGWSVAMAVMKVPLIIVGSVALCVPSLYVFTALAGAEYSTQRFARALAGFCGVAGLVLVGLMPIVWLFSVSTLSLAFVVWLHVFAWLTALVLARGFLLRFASTARAGRHWSPDRSAVCRVAADDDLRSTRAVARSRRAAVPFGEEIVLRAFA